MSRKFIAIVMSAALAVTSMTPAPARAGDDDVAKWIAGAAIAAIIGAAIVEHNDKPKVYWQQPRHHTKPKHHQPKHAHLRNCKHKHGQFGWHTHKNAHGKHCKKGNKKHHGHGHGHGQNGYHGNHGNHGQFGHNPYAGQHNNQNHTGHVPKKHNDPFGVRPLLNTKKLPGNCMVVRNLHGQKFQGFARGCLQRHNINAKRLPQHCKVVLRNHNNGKRRVFFGARCLHKQGYRLAHNY